MYKITLSWESDLIESSGVKDMNTAIKQVKLVENLLYIDLFNLIILVACGVRGSFRILVGVEMSLGGIKIIR